MKSIHYKFPSSKAIYYILSLIMLFKYNKQTYNYEKALEIKHPAPEPKAKKFHTKQSKTTKEKRMGGGISNCKYSRDKYEIRYC